MGQALAERQDHVEGTVRQPETGCFPNLSLP